jgi:hypothetical protein
VRLFLLLLLLFPAISTFVTALKGGFTALAWWQWGLLALLPGLAWLWLRHFSVLACHEGCRPQRSSGLPGGRPAE